MVPVGKQLFPQQPSNYMAFVALRPLRVGFEGCAVWEAGGPSAAEWAPPGLCVPSSTIVGAEPHPLACGCFLCLNMGEGEGSVQGERQRRAKPAMAGRPGLELEGTARHAEGHCGAVCRRRKRGGGRLCSVVGCDRGRVALEK